MTEHETTEVSPLAYLRLPHFSSNDSRSPKWAIVHALPAALYMTLNVWLAGLGMVLMINLAVPVPAILNAILVALVAIPCSALSWGIFVNCIEVEAAIDC